MLKLLSAIAISNCLLFGAIDINSASKEELTKIKGIGDKKAEAIIEYRNKKCFDKIEDLDSVKGFGAKSVEALKSELEVKPCKKGTAKNEEHKQNKTEEKK
ncbi:MAG: helix-hairpin-helix domain-containing protein [Campylobacterales bacterium]|nr:helix-hairpin-helix domain-containing protein [Campylobacterales bacterium]